MNELELWEGGCKDVPGWKGQKQAMSEYIDTHLKISGINKSLLLLLEDVFVAGHRAGREYERMLAVIKKQEKQP